MRFSAIISPLLLLSSANATSCPFNAANNQAIPSLTALSSPQAFLIAASRTATTFSSSTLLAFESLSNFTREVFTVSQSAFESISYVTMEILIASDSATSLLDASETLRVAASKYNGTTFAVLLGISEAFRIAAGIYDGIAFAVLLGVSEALRVAAGTYDVTAFAALLDFSHNGNGFRSRTYSSTITAPVLPPPFFINGTIRTTFSPDCTIYAQPTSDLRIVHFPSLPLIFDHNVNASTNSTTEVNSRKHEILPLSVIAKPLCRQFRKRWHPDKVPRACSAYAEAAFVAAETACRAALAGQDVLEASEIESVQTKEGWDIVKRAGLASLGKWEGMLEEGRCENGNGTTAAGPDAERKRGNDERRKAKRTATGDGSGSGGNRRSEKNGRKQKR